MNLNVRVVTHDIRNPSDNPREAVIDIADTERRAWLHRHMIWAVTNHCAVEVFNVMDDEISDLPLSQGTPSAVPS